MAELRVPKLNNNDTEYLLVEWLAADGTQVAEDDAVALVETSKAAEELTAGAAGVLRHRMRPGVWCRPDDVIAVIGGAAEPSGLDAPDRVSSDRVSSLPAAQYAVAQYAVAQGAGQRSAEQRSAEQLSAEQRSVGQRSAGQWGAAGETAPLITAPAQALIDELGIGLDRVRALGVAVVRRADVERLAAAPADGETRGEHRLSRVQRAVARSVELSRQTIPAAYAVVRMDLGPALEYARAATREIRRPVGLAEVFVQAVASLHARFPLFFATVDGGTVDGGTVNGGTGDGGTVDGGTVDGGAVDGGAVNGGAVNGGTVNGGTGDGGAVNGGTVDGGAVDDGTVNGAATRALLSEVPNIGVTVDVGEGLYVPVVHDAASRTTKDIATTLMKHRLAATTGEFTEGDLSGANFVVTLHTEHGVVLAIPFVYPGTVCALAVPGPRDGTLADIGLAYDHRLINGRDAALFLNALKATVEALARSSNDQGRKV